MSKSIFNAAVFNSKNITNSNNIDNVSTDTLTAENLTVTGTLTNTELQNATNSAINSISFASSSGNLTLTKADSTSVSANLDGRYEKTFLVDTENANQMSFSTETLLGVDYRTLKLTMASGLADDNNGLVTSKQVYDGLQLRALQFIVNSANPNQMSFTTETIDTIDYRTLKLTMASSLAIDNNGLVTSKQVYDGLQLRALQFIVNSANPNQMSFTTETIDTIDYRTLKLTMASSLAIDNNGLVTSKQVYDGLELRALQFVVHPDSDSQLAFVNHTPSGSTESYRTLKVQLATAIADGDGKLVTSNLAYDTLYVNTPAFDTATGNFSFVRGGTTLSANLDGRYITNIVSSNTTPQFVVKTETTSGIDAEVEIRGARGSATDEQSSRLILSNYDNQLAATNKLVEIAGQVSNSSTNVGGLVISNYENGATRTEALTMDYQGNFLINKNLTVNGVVTTTGVSHRITTLVFDKSDVMLSDGDPNSDDWGINSRQNVINSNRSIGASIFNDISVIGELSINTKGMYRIKYTSNVKQTGHNNRITTRASLSVYDIATSAYTHYRTNNNYDLFCWGYTRNTSDAACVTMHFEDFIELDIPTATTGNRFYIRCDLETDDTGSPDFTSTLPNGDLQWYSRLQLELMYTT